MYATMPLDTVLGEVREVGAASIDLWPRVHSDHRDQVRAMGIEAFHHLLEKHRVGLGVVTCYPQGPFRLQSEMEFAAKLGGTSAAINRSRRYVERCLLESA